MVLVARRGARMSRSRMARSSKSARSPKGAKPRDRRFRSDRRPGFTIATHYDGANMGDHLHHVVVWTA